MGNDALISLGFLKISLVSSYSLKRYIYYTAQDIECLDVQIFEWTMMRISSSFLSSSRHTKNKMLPASAGTKTL